MIDGKRILGLVPARAGSERLPGKNTRPMAGKPMIAWTLEAAKASRLLDRLVISTDDPAIAPIAESLGCEPPLARPEHLAGAQASVVDAALHVLDQVGGDWDHLVLLQPTSPLRLAEDIDAAIELCVGRKAPAVIGVSPLSKPEAFHGRLDAEQRLTLNVADPAAGRPVIVNGAVYVVAVDALVRERSFRPAGTLAHVMPPERGGDVDDDLDFRIAEALLLARA